jgi:AAA domain
MSEPLSGDPWAALDAGVQPEKPSEWRRRSFAEVTARSVRWLVPGVVPLRTSTLVAGQGGLGKSTWLMAVAAQVTTGKLNGGRPAAVIVVSFEDTIEEILRPRADAAGADLERMFEITVPVELGGAVLLPRDIERLNEQLEETGARLVVIDPVLAAISLQLDAHKDQHMRVVLAQLADLAEKHHCAIVLVLHLNKAPAVDPYLRISSSSGFYNAARSVVVVVPDPEEPEEHRLVAQVKSNWSRRSPVERHVLREILLDSRDPETGEQIATSRMEFVEVAAGVDRDSILGSGRRDTGEQVSKAADWLEGMLADGDWHDSAGLKNLAAAQEISERTLQRAAGEEVQVEHERRGFPAATYWRLPTVAPALIDTTVGATGEEGSNPHEHTDSEPATEPVGPVAPSFVGVTEPGVTGSRFCPECTTPEVCAERVFCAEIDRLPAEAS